MVWFRPLMSPESSWRLGPEGSSVQSWGFGKWLDHEVSELSNEFIHQWVLNLMGYWEVMGTRRWDLSKGSKSLRVCLEGYILYPTPSFLSASQLPGGEQLCSTTCMMLCLTPESMEPSVDGLKPETVRGNTFFSPLSWFSQVFCHSDGKETNRVLGAPSSFWAQKTKVIGCVTVFIQDWGKKNNSVRSYLEINA
jgi:hypothetical protein